MMYVDPASQYKFVAKTTPSLPSSEPTSPTIGSDAATSSTAENIVLTTPQTPTNDATHFQAAEHAQKQAALLQNAGVAPQPGQATPSPGQIVPGQATGAVAGAPGQGLTYDGKRMRKSVQRRTVDYNSSVIRFLEARKWFKSSRNQHALQPQEIYNVDVVPPCGYIKNPMNAVTTKFVRTSTNKLRCPIFCVVWTPEGRRLVTGASSGEFTLWNGLTFNFETILQAHDRAVRSMVWSHNDSWLLTGDHGGFVKYWQSNMNNVRMYEAHKDPVRGLSFSPSDNKFASCSDDGLVKIWDFYRCAEERELKGHGADVKCVDWHPSKGLLVSGSKDSQQPVKLWDPKSGNSITTLHCHKSTVMTAKWNSNGNWLVTGSRDHLLKLFDIRMMKELQTFRGHKKEATVVAWHPIHETLFASGGSDGSLMFWLTGVDEKAGAMDKAHEGIVWSLSWHPLGHILCSGSNDHTSKFWARNRPGDVMTDKYNLDIQGTQEDGEYNDEGTAQQTSVPALAAYDASAVIPGVGLPVTASNVVLPDSKDVDVHLYGETSKENHKTSSSVQPSTTTVSTEFPYPSAFKQSIRPSLAKPTIPGLDILTSSGPEIQGSEGSNVPKFPPTSTPQLRLPPRLPRPSLGNRPPFASNPGNRPQFGLGPGHGFDFHAPPGPGGEDSNMNFGSPGQFPPNQFMRFRGPPGFMPEGVGGGFGPGGHPPGPRWGGSRGHLPGPHGPPDSVYRGPRPQHGPPGQPHFGDGFQGGSWPRGGPNNPNIRLDGPRRGQRPHDISSSEQPGPNVRPDGPYAGARGHDIPPRSPSGTNARLDSPYRGSRESPQSGSHDESTSQHGRPRLNIPISPHGTRDGPQGSRDFSHGPRDAPHGLHGSRDGPQRPRDAPYGPKDGSQGPRDAPHGLHGSRDGPQGPRDDLHGPKEGSQGLRDAPQGPRDGPLGQRDGPQGQRDGAHGQRVGPHGPRDGSHGPRDAPQGPRDGPHGQRDAPHGQGDAPHGPRDGSHRPRDGAHGPRDGPPGPRDGSHRQRDAPHEPRDGPHGQRDSTHGPKDASQGQRDGPHGPRDGPQGPRDGPHRPRDGTQESRDGTQGPRDDQHGSRDSSQDPRVDPSRGFFQDRPTGQHGLPHERPRLNIPPSIQGSRDGPHVPSPRDSLHGLNPRDYSRGPRDASQGACDEPTNQHGLPRPTVIPLGQHGLRDDPKVGPRKMNDNGPHFGSRGPTSPQFQQPRTDHQMKQELKSPEGNQRKAPEIRDNFPRRSRDNSPRDSPPVVLKQDRRTSDSGAPGILGDYVTHVMERNAEMQRGIFEKFAKAAVEFGQQMADTHQDHPLPGRSDVDRSHGPDRSPHRRSEQTGDCNRSEGDRRGVHPPFETHDRPDSERRPPRDRRDPGERERDRLSFDRPGIGRREERSPHDRSDMGRPGDRKRDRPSLEDRSGDRPSRRSSEFGPGESRRSFDRPGSGRLSDRSFSDEGDLPTHGKPGLLPTPDRPSFDDRSGDRSRRKSSDISQPGGRPPFDRPDSGRQSERSFSEEGDIPAHEKPGLLPIPDLFFGRGLPPDGQPRDAASNHHPPEGWSHDRRRDHGRFQDARNEFDNPGFNRDSRGAPEMAHGNARSGGGHNDGPPASGVKPLMSLLDAPPISLGSSSEENRGRKRSMEHEFDRPPKRMGPGDNRERFR